MEWVIIDITSESAGMIYGCYQCQISNDNEECFNRKIFGLDGYVNLVK